MFPCSRGPPKEPEEAHDATNSATALVELF
jgi:hypothetical protein